MKSTQITEDYPFKNSLLSLTLESEIKRIAESREESIANTIDNLAKLTGVTPRQIYNYRMGKTQIPDELLLLFCKQFASTAMVSAWLAENEICIVDDLFDLIRLANHSARQVLKTHDQYLEAFDDKKIDGHELTELKKSTANSIACLTNLQTVAEINYQKKAA